MIRHRKPPIWQKSEILNQRFDQIDEFDRAFLASLKGVINDFEPDTPRPLHPTTFQTLDFGDLD